ncbi:MAG: hypothetical protein ACKV22_29785 [Bryobacteraceae bacterium]
MERGYLEDAALALAAGEPALRHHHGGELYGRPRDPELIKEREEHIKSRQKK